MFKQMIIKLLSALLPLFFGLSSWFFRFGPGVSYSINYTIIMVFWIVYATWFYYDVLEYACKHYMVIILNKKIHLPSWKNLIVPAFLLLLFASYIYCPQSLVIQSLWYGVLISAFSEELLTRSVFIRYRMFFFEFLCFNVISSLAFSVMHAGFEAAPVPLWDYVFLRGHFAWSFMLNIVVYRTQRIEMTMLIHALSNLIRYTIPVLIVGNNYTGSVLQSIFVCIEYVVLAFAVKQSVQAKE